MVARVLLAVSSPSAISCCSLTSESSFAPVAGVVTQEQIKDGKTQRRRKGGKADRRKEVVRGSDTVRRSALPPFRPTLAIATRRSRRSAGQIGRAHAGTP